LHVNTEAGKASTPWTCKFIPGWTQSARAHAALPVPEQKGRYGRNAEETNGNGCHAQDSRIMTSDRDQIALVALPGRLRENGFDQGPPSCASLAKPGLITTGMVAHYLASTLKAGTSINRALRTQFLRRIGKGASDEAIRGCTDRPAHRPVKKALPIDEQRYIECAFWTSVLGARWSADKRPEAASTHGCTANTMRLFERWPFGRLDSLGPKLDSKPTARAGAQIP